MILEGVSRILCKKALKLTKKAIILREIVKKTAYARRAEEKAAGRTDAEDKGALKAGAIASVRADAQAVWAADKSRGRAKTAGKRPEKTRGNSGAYFKKTELVEPDATDLLNHRGFFGVYFPKYG